MTIDEPFAKFRDDLSLMAAASRMVNLVGAVMAEGDAEPRVFRRLEQGLRSLLMSRDVAWTTLLFQIRLLGLSGFRPQTDHCAACGPGQSRPLPNFSPLAGARLRALRQPTAGSRTVLSRGSAAFLHQALQMQPALVNRLHAAGQVRTEVEAAIESYVTVVAGRRLPPIDFLASGPPARPLC
ncbi:MAG: DNA repair protein RecO [Nitrospiraceae bacterium]